VGFDTVGPIAEVVRLTGDTSCNVTVYVLPIIACSTEPLDGAKAVTVGKVTVVLPCGEITYCEPPFDCAPATAQPLALCNYSDMCNDAGCPYPVGAENGADVRAGPLAVHSDCAPQELCSGPFRCTSPFDDGVSSATALPVQVTVSKSLDPLHVDVFVKADVMDCLWGEGYNPTPVGPYLTLWTWGCRPPTQASTSSVPCTCPPPQPLCYQVVRAISETPIVSIDDWCNVNVFLEAYCGLQGTPEDHYVKAPKVTIDVQTCRGPPPA
jgi:hypothetical protein